MHAPIPLTASQPETPIDELLFPLYFSRHCTILYCTVEHGVAKFDDHSSSFQTEKFERSWSHLAHLCEAQREKISICFAKCLSCELLLGCGEIDVQSNEVIRKISSIGPAQWHGRQRKSKVVWRKMGP